MKMETHSQGIACSLGLAIGLALGCALGCSADEEDDAALDGALMVPLDSQMTPERRTAFEAEFARATERFDYAQLDPAEVFEGRKLDATHLRGRSFRRYVIDGREVAKNSHEALRSGKSAGRMWRIPYYYDPLDRFVVVRQIFKIDDTWEVIAEDWIILPAAE